MTFKRAGKTVSYTWTLKLKEQNKIQHVLFPIVTCQNASLSYSKGTDVIDLTV